MPLPQYLREPWKPPVDYVLRMKENFGWRFSVMLCSAYLGVKGSLYTFTGLIQLPYYKSLGVSGRDYQIYGSVAVTPFSVKGLIGTISDTIPLFGFHKSSYIILVAVLGGLSFILLATTTLTAAQSACLFFLVSVETSVVDLLVEGKYAELMREKPETGGDMVTWVWGTYHLGALLAACITGPVVDQGNTWIIFWICLPIALQVILPISQGYLKDARLPEGHRGPKWEKLKAYPRVFSLACLMATCALVQAAVNLAFRNQPSVQMTYTLTVAVSLCLLSFYCLPRRLALCNLFMFLDAALYIQIGGALDYWYTSDSTCVLGGPNFDYTYYATYVRIVAAIASFVGVVLFQTVMAGWQIRTIFYVSVLLRCAGGVFDIIIVQRWNIAVGISDKTMFMIGDAIIYDICYTLNFMPAVLLTSKLCPKEMESTTYALLAGFQNFGQQVSRTIGVALITAFDIKTEPPCKWQGLSGLMPIAHMILPLLLVPLTFMLLPASQITENLLEKECFLGEAAPPDRDTNEIRLRLDLANDSVRLIERKGNKEEGGRVGGQHGVENVAVWRHIQGRDIGNGAGVIFSSDEVVAPRCSVVPR